MSDLQPSTTYQGLGEMCGEGSHEVCQRNQMGLGHHHFNRPDLDNGQTFTCACGCHYVPPYRGEVPIYINLPVPPDV